ncbi:MAG TPA: hypothetical protein VG938_18125 [Verrucomicrobiae bacterium]|jgi:hypothetical protein|nr:hypothetical protein [Verrucomicrobiae bacterium]
MRRLILLICFHLGLATGFSQTLPIFDSAYVVHFQRTNLVVRWKAAKRPWPKTLWTYKIVPTHFSPAAISNVTALADFGGYEKRDYGRNGFFLGNWYGTPQLRVSFVAGEIQFDNRVSERNYSPTNLAKDVPGTNRLLQLTTNFLPKVGISLGEVARRANGQLKIGWHDNDYTEYRTDNGNVTNIEYRTVWVWRALDGVENPGMNTDCQISFGEHDKVVQIRLEWPSVERETQFAAATPEKIIQWIREGKAAQSRVFTSPGGAEIPIDWSKVKSLTITNAEAKYWGPSLRDREFVNQPLFPAWVRPDARLQGIVNTGTTNLNVQILCPVIDESKPLN